MPVPLKTDVLVIGGGNAALCAGIAAREAGAGVLILERAEAFMRGGNTRHTRNLRAVHDAPTATMPGSYTEEEYLADLMQVTAGHTSLPLARLLVRRSQELPGWLQDRGLRLQPSISGALNLSRTNAFFLGGGRALLNALYQTAKRLGIQVLYQSEVQSLDIQAGSFDSARVASEDGVFEVRAGAVILASGGFQANISWLKEIWGEAAENFLIRGTPFNEGNLLRALLDEGMQQAGVKDQCHAVAIDARAPRFDGGIVTRLDCICFGVVVNREGDRFYDEGEDFWPKRYAIWGRLLMEQPGQKGYAIVDSKTVHSFMPSLFPPYEADSVAGLAEVLQLDPGKLQKTLTEFNQAVVPGTFDIEVLDDCRTQGITPPKSHWALPIDRPPYYAWPLAPGITFTYLGLAVNEEARVLQAGGRPCRNIFAAGEIMAGNILGQGYSAGTGMTIGGVFGRIAGETAARELADV